MADIAHIADTFADALARTARLASCDRVLIVGHAPALLKKLKSLRAKVIFAVSDARHQDAIECAGFTALGVPPMQSSRTDRLTSALAAAMNSSLIMPAQQLACAVVRDDGVVDMLMHLTADAFTADRPSLQVARMHTRIPAPLLEVLADLALRIGREGYEGRPLGTLIVVGDATRVLEQSTPLTLNPFQGYSEQERNLFSHEVRSAVRTFAMLDGAFVVRDDGVVLAAGRHIQVTAPPDHLPLG